jgi:hypothetical protein
VLSSRAIIEWFERKQKKINTQDARRARAVPYLHRTRHAGHTQGLLQTHTHTHTHTHTRARALTHTHSAAYSAAHLVPLGWAQQLGVRQPIHARAELSGATTAVATVRSVPDGWGPGGKRATA